MVPRAGRSEAIRIKGPGWEIWNLVLMATKSMQVLRHEWERVQQVNLAKNKGTKQSELDIEEAPLEQKCNIGNDGELCFHQTQEGSLI